MEEANRRQRRSALTGSVTPSFNPYAGEVTQLMEERNAMREEIAHLQESLAAATTEKAGVSFAVTVLSLPCLPILIKSTLSHAFFIIVYPAS